MPGIKHPEPPTWGLLARLLSQFRFRDFTLRNLAGERRLALRTSVCANPERSAYYTSSAYDAICTLFAWQTRREGGKRCSNF